MNRIKKDVNYLQNMIDYAKRNLKKGYTTDSLRWALIGQGHSRIEVDKAIAQAQSEFTRENLSSNRVAPLQIEQPSIQVEPEEKKSFWKRFFS